MMTNQEIIAVVQAAEEGKQIEARLPYNDHEWRPAIPRWNFNQYEYRVKPAEKKLVPHWPAVYANDTHTWISDYLFPSVDVAMNLCGFQFLRLATEYPAVMLEVGE